MVQCGSAVCLNALISLRLAHMLMSSKANALRCMIACRSNRLAIVVIARSAAAVLMMAKDGDADGQTVSEC